jgi:Apea-like HEPN
MADAAAQIAESYSIAVFPFLKTTATVQIGDMTFRSTDDIAGLSADRARSVVEVAEMLFLQDDLRIKSASYSMLSATDLEHPGPVLDKLKRIQTVVAYCYAIPHHISGDPHLRYEHASLAVFSPGRVWPFMVRPEYHVEPQSPDRSPVPDERGEIEGYNGLYNFKHHFWVAKGSRVYPPLPQIGLNMAQDLAVDLEDFSGTLRFQLLPDLIQEPASGMAERALRSIAWFNEANSLSAGDDAAVVNLAIALESLLGLPEDQKSKRLVDSVALLLGRVPRLDEWATQFYDVRSEIVHQGRASELRFKVAESKKPASSSLYNSLLSYGRQIFQLCVATLLFGASIARKAALEEKFVTNRERFEQISRMLSDESIAASERFRAISEKVGAIELYRSIAESSFPITIVLDAMRLAAKVLLSCEPNLEPELRRAAESVATATQSHNSYEVLHAVQEFHEAGKQKAPTADPTSHWGLTFRLVDAGWDYVFWNYHSLRKQKESESPASGS